ncbi:MAG: (deoxy)nucleoside triphosphate pyrophosphohydrolase [Nitrospirales bacterium]
MTGSSSSDGRRPILVAAGLILHDGRCLITRRRQGTPLGGLWEFPGGKCEPGEPLEACLRRELLEELGVAIGEARVLTVVRHEYPEHTVELHFFLCGLAGESEPMRDRIRPFGCEAFRWVTPEEMDGFEFPPADRPVLEMLRAGVIRHP